MKKIFIFLLATVFVFGIAAVSAQDLGGSGLTNVAGKAGINQAPLESKIGSMIASILGMLGTIFLVLTIYAGVLWMTASGDEGKIEKAKEIITAAVIGLAIVLSAYTITYFVGSKLGSASNKQTCSCFTNNEIGLNECVEAGGSTGNASLAGCDPSTEFACCVND
ncbi:MAG TPA: pilin [Candidatus Magasanikbacteria bacterium]|nr:pilin [Candidatus Magasanikbacteria bacterium]